MQKVDAETALLVGDGLGSKRRRSAAVAAAAAAATAATDQAGLGSVDVGGAGAGVGAGAGTRNEAVARTMAGAMAARKGRNRKITIDESRHCVVCHKRFGASAVRVYPDNSVVHYGCIGGAGQKNQKKGIFGFGDYGDYR